MRREQQFPKTVAWRSDVLHTISSSKSAGGPRSLYVGVWPKMSKYPKFVALEASLDPPTVLVTAKSGSGELACVRCGREQLRTEWLDPAPDTGVLEGVCQPCHLMHNIQELLKDPSMPASEAVSVGSALATLYKSMLYAAHIRARDRSDVRAAASRAEASGRKRPRAD